MIFLRNHRDLIHRGLQSEEFEDSCVWRQDPDDRIQVGEGNVAREPQPSARADRIPGVRAHNPDGRERDAGDPAGGQLDDPGRCGAPRGDSGRFGCGGGICAPEGGVCVEGFQNVIESHSKSLAQISGQYWFVDQEIDQR